MAATSSFAIRDRFRIREKLLRIKANPRKVSLGYALGVFLGTTPFIGTKVFIALICTYILKWNKVSSIIGVYHINILTAPLFYGFSFLAGKWILGYDVVFIFPDTFTFSAFWEAFAGNMMIFYCLLAGGIALGLPMAVGGYYLSMFMLKGHKGTAEQGRRTKDEGRGTKYPVPSPPVYTLITGASSGLGREMAIECAARRMNVILVALPGRNLDVLCDMLEKEYHIIARYYEEDLTSRGALEGLVEDVLKHYRVNFLINNAGTGGTIPFEESSVDYLERIILLNITAVSLLTRLLVPELRKHPEAWILNVSSMAAFSPFPYKTIYPASKAFVSNFSRSLGQELKDSGVRVGVLHPGPIATNPDVTIRIIRQGANGRRGLLPARELARIGITGIKSGKRVMIPGMGNILNWLMMTKLPKFIVLPTLSRAMVREIRKEELVAA